jgi:hypothetical protein
MKRIGYLFLMLMMALTGAVAVAQPKVRVSPHEVSTARFETGHISVYYGRPYRKDPKTGEQRQVWGGVVPFGKVWRTGANEATLLVTHTDITLADNTRLPAGAYSLYSIPAEDGSLTLIVNKQVGQWGTRYDETQDVVRLKLTGTEVKEPVEQFTIQLARVEKTNQGTITLSWEHRAFTTKFTYEEKKPETP